MLFAHVSSNKYGVGDILNESVWRSQLVGYKMKGYGPTLEEKRPDHDIRSSVAITKLPLGHDILKKKNNNNKKKEKCDFLNIIFLWICFYFLA